MPRIRRKSTIKEMIDNSRLDVNSFEVRGSLRSTSTFTSQSFRHSTNIPLSTKTQVNAEQARRLYFNLDGASKYGAAFAQPIIDTATDFIDLPTLVSGDEEIDFFLNGCVNDYWAGAFKQMYRQSMRDAKVWVRLRLPRPGPLISDQEQNRIHLEVIEDDRVTPYYNPFTNNLQRVEILSEVFIEDEPFQISDVISNLSSRGRLHQIVEIITPDEYRYFDKSDGVELAQLASRNDWGFVAMVPIVNEPDSTLYGGKSDLENVYPWLLAFNEVFEQARYAHKYHSVPKATFKLADIDTFLQNNFPESFDAEGRFNGIINWTGKEIFFLEVGDEAGFVEARSVLDDSTTLLQFIFNCICVASETPAWAFMWVTGVISQGAVTPQTLPFEKKIKRKRDFFQEPIQMITKMALTIYNGTPLTVSLSWPEIQPSDEVTKSQAMNQEVAAAEVANRSGVITRSTYRSTIRKWFPAMKTDAEEEAQAQQELQQELQNQEALAAAKHNGSTGPNSAQRVPMDVAARNN